MLNKVVICGIDTAALPSFSAKESMELLKNARMGDEKARERFIMGNMRLVLSVIKRFPSAKENPDDLFQAGCIGLIKAIDNFDVNLGVMFSTYAVPMIMGEVKRLIRGYNSLRIPRSVRDTAYNVLKTRAEIEAEDKNPSYEEIARRMNTSESEVVYALDAIADTVSLFEPVYNKDGDELELMDKIEDEKNNDEAWTERLALEQAFEKLGKREQNIIYMRYYEGKTQTEVSSEIGLSQAQVSRLEKNALKEMKGNLCV